MPLQGYARAKILAVRLSRDEMHARMFKATVYEIFRLTGVGNHDIDWRIASGEGRPVLIEVKSRFKDLLEMLNQIEEGEYNPDGTAPAPKHDVSFLFRSIEQKYPQSDPTLQLQGAWIATYVQQEETELSLAFAALDGLKVHFVILGDWEPGIKLLTRRDEDYQFLISLFREETSDRFHFSRESAAAINK